MNFDRKQLETILEWHGSKPSQYVETGTMYGATARMASEVFDRVYTIELSPGIASAVRGRFIATANVVPLEGDSRDLLPVICELEGPGPMVFYLDAHGCREPETAGAGKTALWDELRYLATRNEDDLIIVDDVHAFGGGADGPNPFWAGVTFPSILKAMTGRWMRHEVFGDQFAMSCCV